MHLNWIFPVARNESWSVRLNPGRLRRRQRRVNSESHRRATGLASEYNEIKIPCISRIPVAQESSRTDLLQGSLILQCNAGFHNNYYLYNYNGFEIIRGFINKS